jgi:hypothetical protein
MRDFIVICGV